MNLGLDLSHNAPGLLCAAAAVAAGAPIFARGLRALKLRQHLEGLRSAAIADAPEGLVHLRGKVTLEQPLRGPISGLPCAGFRLEARTLDTASFEHIDEVRRFSLEQGSYTARVVEDPAAWEVQVTGQREIKAGDNISQQLATLIKKMPEPAWARSAGATLQIVERALITGSECHVVGFVRHAPPMEMEAELPVEVAAEAVWLRTGTDNESWGVSSSGNGDASAAKAPALWVGRGEHLEFLLISDQAPEARRLAPPLWQAIGAFVGPILSLSGLVYLARALDVMRAAGRH
ncbi:MAG: hypothetical protein ACRENS_08970 [Candidatus Eiseniibacteriota bacterium]